MRYRKRKRVATWKVIRRCVVFFTAICVIPVLLVLLVSTDQYMRPGRGSHMTFIRPEGGRIEHTLLMTKNMTIVENRFKERRELMTKMCDQMGLDAVGNDTLHKPNPWEFLINKKHHLVWCNVFKAGSSSWMYNFNILAGYDPNFLKKTKQVPLTLARMRYPRPTLTELRKWIDDSVTFLIVRHPLERLLSGYKDKIQYSLPHTYHRKLGYQIILKYRPKSNQDEYMKKLRYPTFQEFVSYVLESYQNGEQLDMHWTPITEFCTPCLFDFQYIAHTETLQEDQEYIIKRAGLDKLIKPEWKNAGRGQKQIDVHYSQLTRSQIMQLYHIYRYDFELFNYTLDGYLQAAQVDKDPADLLKAISMKELPLKYSVKSPQHREIIAAAAVSTSAIKTSDMDATAATTTNNNSTSRT